MVNRPGMGYQLFHMLVPLHCNVCLAIQSNSYNGSRSRDLYTLHRVGMVGCRTRLCRPTAIIKVALTYCIDTLAYITLHPHKTQIMKVPDFFFIYTGLEYTYMYMQ